MRPVAAGDLPAFFEHQRDPVAVALVGFRSRERAAFDEHWSKLLRDESTIARSISLEGKVAGHISSFIRDGKREVGYWIDRSLWGRGIVTEALGAFLRIDLERPLHAVVARHNAASLRVLQKYGFEILPAENSDGPVHLILRHRSATSE